MAAGAGRGLRFTLLSRLYRHWKRYRKVLPPSARDLLAELLLDLRGHVIPEEHLSAVSNIGLQM